MEHEGDRDTNCRWCTWNNLSKARKFGNWSMNKNHPNSIVKIGQNTEKVGDLLSLQWKTNAGVKKLQVVVVVVIIIIGGGV